MENKIFCQSCGMPLDSAEDFGTEKDGSASADYCKYCYVNGAFNNDGETMEEMIETCIPFVTGEDGPYKSEDEARKAMTAFFPNLKRWAKA